jgi:hypothetical protein
VESVCFGSTKQSQASTAITTIARPRTSRERFWRFGRFTKNKRPSYVTALEFADSLVKLEQIVMAQKAARINCDIDSSQIWRNMTAKARG